MNRHDCVGYFTNIFINPQIKNADAGNCLDTFGRKGGENIALSPCHKMGGNQVKYLFLLFYFILFCHCDVLLDTAPNIFLLLSYQDTVCRI